MNILLFKAKAFEIEVSQILCFEMKFFVASVVILSAFVGLSLSHLEGRIIGGFPINITEAPYQVSLNLRGSHYCGGSILSEKFVLSAAHCMQDLKKYEKLFY